MAALLFLLLFLSSFHLGSSQAVFGPSPIPSLAPPTSPNPSLAPPTGYIPFHDGTVREDGTNEVPEEPPAGRTISFLPTQNLRTQRPTQNLRTQRPTQNLLIQRPTQRPTQNLLTLPTASQPIKTEVAFSRATIGPMLPHPTVTTTPSSDVTVTRPRPQREEGRGPGGSDPVPTATEQTGATQPDPPDTPGTETSRFQSNPSLDRSLSPTLSTLPHEDPTLTTLPHEGSSLKMAAAQTPPALSVTVKPSPSDLTGALSPSPPGTRATLHPTAALSDPTAAPLDPTAAPLDATPAHTTAQAGLLTGELTANTPSMRQESSTITEEPRTTSKPTSVEKASPSPSKTTSVEKASPSPLSTQRGTNSPISDPQPNTTQPNIRGGSTTPASYVNITLHPTRTNATQPGRTTTTTTATKTGNTFLRNTTGVPGGRGRQGESPAPPVTPPPPPTAPPPNGTMLLWADLWRTLSFAWPLHVYGSAGLFLLLFAGAALGLVLSPSMRSPHRGALCLANALLFLAGGLRACLFLIDPYGSRQLLPRQAVTALYNLPLPLLVWSQAALALLALRQVEVSALPPTLERLPLAAVMTVLQCTLLLSVDLLSTALSPAVPVTLQVLSLVWGLAVCLGFLCYVFPRLRCPAASAGSGSGVGSEAEAKHGSGSGTEAEGKAWPRGRRTGLVLGRVLAVCALLGALCCGLHVHATLWLYGILGEWRRFNWGWWLVHFWARLLELAWGFSLLLLGSWVFWRPAGGPGREEGSWAFWRPAGGPGCEEGGPGDGRSGAELPSPGGQSTASSQRHTCWSKIVQSLTGKSCKKSDSNGLVSGAGGVSGGEVPPNNWAGLQVSPAPPGGGGGGADISKSLIRNQSSNQSHDTVGNKNSNHGRNLRARSADRGGPAGGSTGSLLRLQALGGSRGAPAPPQKDPTDPSYSSLSLYDFDLRPPSPIDLGRSIDDALHREHLLGAGSLFQPLSLGPSSPYRPPSPGPWGGPSPPSPGPWLRRNNSDPQLLSDSSCSESSGPGRHTGSVMSSVPSRQVTEPPTPSHQGGGGGALPSSVSCPVSLQRPSRTSSLTEGPMGGTEDDTRPFLTPDSNRLRGGRGGRGAGSRSNSVSSEIIDL